MVSWIHAQVDGDFLKVPQKHWFPSTDFLQCPKIRRFLLASLALVKSHGIPRTRKCPVQEALAEQLGAPEGNLEMTAENFAGNFMKCGKLPFFLREFWKVLTRFGGDAKSAGIKINIEAGGAPTKLMPKLVICGIPQFLHNLPVFFLGVDSTTILGNYLCIILILMYYLIYNRCNQCNPQVFKLFLNGFRMFILPWNSAFLGSSPNWYRRPQRHPRPMSPVAPPGAKPMRTRRRFTGTKLWEKQHEPTIIGI